jgi:hypothetical protein
MHKFHDFTQQYSMMQDEERRRRARDAEKARGSQRTLVAPAEFVLFCYSHSFSPLMWHDTAGSC